MPILFSTPSSGLGGGFASTFFEEAQRNADGSKKLGPSGQPIPPDVTALGGGISIEGSWAVSAGPFGVLRGDRIRYTVGAGYRSINLDYYGAAGALKDNPRPFNIEGPEIEADLQVRLGNTPLFAGFRYVHTLNDVDFDRLPEPFELVPTQFNSSNAVLGAGL